VGIDKLIKIAPGRFRQDGRLQERRERPHLRGHVGGHGSCEDSGIRSSCRPAALARKERLSRDKALRRKQRRVPAVNRVDLVGGARNSRGRGNDLRRDGTPSQNAMLNWSISVS
jgi:hypothetical protein